jgi:hypothetical protein
LGKFDSRDDEGIFLGYSSRSKAYRCYNKALGKIVESANVKVDEVGTSEGERKCSNRGSKMKRRRRRRRRIK